jgi:hypothetical protein
MMRLGRGSVIFIFLAVLFLVDGKSNFTVRNNKIYDSSGGELIFHGMNVVMKEKPYYFT